jgi:hypothetical protein
VGGQPIFPSTGQIAKENVDHGEHMEYNSRWVEVPQRATASEGLVQTHFVLLHFQMLARRGRDANE